MIPKAKDITYVRNQLAELKGMEDKYLEDSLIRLKENAIKKRVDAKKREEKIADLNVQLKDLNGKTTQNTEGGKINHEQRVKEVLGN